MSTLPADEPRCDELHEENPVELLIKGRPRGVGSLTVARLLPAARRRMVGPFIFVDHMGPVTLPPGGGFDIKPHPHIGLSTVTYLFEGENVHRDSLGTVQANRAGDLNIMTAGRGVVHSERATPELRARGGALHGVQIWLALPTEHEDDAPSFQHHPQATLPVIAPAPCASGRVVLGEAFGARSPVTHPSSPLLVDLELDAGARVDVPASVAECGVFVIAGEAAIGDAMLGVDDLAVLRAGARACIETGAPSRVLVLGGPSLGKRFIDWNFVASSVDRIERARRGWKEQTFPKIPGDDQEFVPLPADLPPLPRG